MEGILEIEDLDLLEDLNLIEDAIDNMLEEELEKDPNPTVISIFIAEAVFIRMAKIGFNLESSSFGDVLASNLVPFGQFDRLVFNNDVDWKIKTHNDRIKATVKLAAAFTEDNLGVKPDDKELFKIPSSTEEVAEILNLLVMKIDWLTHMEMYERATELNRLIMTMNFSSPTDGDHYYYNKLPKHRYEINYTDRRDVSLSDPFFEFAIFRSQLKEYKVINNLTTIRHYNFMDQKDQESLIRDVIKCVMNNSFPDDISKQLGIRISLVYQIYVDVQLKIEARLNSDEYDLDYKKNAYPMYKKFRNPLFVTE